MVSRLGQNSQETRLRYARFLIRWFFADGLDGIARKTWVAYQGEKILTDILRYLYLANEPVMGACVADCLFPIEFGMRVPPSVFDRFLSNHYGSAPTKKTTQRLKTNLMRLGVLERRPGEDDELVALNPSKTSLLLLTHHIFASAEPRTIEFEESAGQPVLEVPWLQNDGRAEESCPANEKRAYASDEAIGGMQVGALACARDSG